MRYRCEMFILPILVIVGILILFLLNVPKLSNDFVIHFNAERNPDAQIPTMVFPILMAMFAFLTVAFITAIEYLIGKGNKQSFTTKWFTRFTKFFLLGIMFAVTQVLVECNTAGVPISEAQLLSVAAIITVACMAIIGLLEYKESGHV